mmetsp:Transcript_11533/g.13057  ORF Transcript_11533/g.13057 Transcript_11533/m.13057 type:complete len:154 (+) Transcript_11533:32-493(+)
MNLRNIGLILLLTGVLYTGFSRFADPSKTSDVLRKNMVEGFRFLRLAYGVDFDEKLIIEYTKYINYTMGSFEIGISLYLILFESFYLVLLHSSYILLYAALYFNPYIVPSVNKTKIDYCERMFFFHILTIMGLYICAGVGKEKVEEKSSKVHC